VIGGVDRIDNSGTRNHIVDMASVQHKEKEYEAIIFAATTGNNLKAIDRVHALCDDACLFAPEVFVTEEVFSKKVGGLATGTGSRQEVHVRTIQGDVICHDPTSLQVCAAGVYSLPAAFFENGARVETVNFGKFPFEVQKQVTKSANISPANIRSMIRSNATGNIAEILKEIGFSSEHTFSTRGMRYLTRDHVEVNIFRLTEGFKSSNFIVPHDCSSVDEAPFMITIKSVARKDEDQQKAAKNVRDFANLLCSGADILEVRHESLFSYQRR